MNSATGMIYCALRNLNYFLIMQAASRKVNIVVKTAFINRGKYEEKGKGNLREGISVT